jgi:transporter family-2 protein
MELVYVILALLAGACGPAQAGINAQLRLWTKDPVFAAMISFAVGTTALLAYLLLLRVPCPDLGRVRELPWWIWTGGFLGAFLVVVSVILAPRLGAATMMGFIIAGQVFAGMILDHFGVLGYQIHEINGWRLFGAVLLIVGVAIIKIF